VATVDWFASHAEVAEEVPVPRRRPPRTAKRAPAPARARRKPTQRRVRAHIVWMILFALLLAGVVAINVAVLRAHVAVSHLDQQRAELQAQNQALKSQLSAASSAPRVEAAALRFGMILAPVADTSYIALPSGRR
jgi:cell division protein FtsL